MERSLQFHNSADSTTVMNGLHHSRPYTDRLLANHNSSSPASIPLLEAWVEQSEPKYCLKLGLNRASPSGLSARFEPLTQFCSKTFLWKLASS
jgi:hypothetical protein